MLNGTDSLVTQLPAIRRVIGHCFPGHAHHSHNSGPPLSRIEIPKGSTEGTRVAGLLLLYRLSFRFCWDLIMVFSSSRFFSTWKLYSSFSWFSWYVAFICWSCSSRIWHSKGKDSLSCSQDTTFTTDLAPKDLGKNGSHQRRKLKMNPLPQTQSKTW